MGRLLSYNLDHARTVYARTVPYSRLTRIEQILLNLEKKMAALDDQITALNAEVTKNTTVEKSALALIQGFSARLDAAVSAGTGSGRNAGSADGSDGIWEPSLKANDDELAAAVVANTPTPPSPAQP